MGSPRLIHRFACDAPIPSMETQLDEDCHTSLQHRLSPSVLGRYATQQKGLETLDDRQGI